jgi:invasion protein IalB
MLICAGWYTRVSSGPESEAGSPWRTRITPRLTAVASRLFDPGRVSGSTRAGPCHRGGRRGHWRRPEERTDIGGADGFDILLRGQRRDGGPTTSCLRQYALTLVALLACLPPSVSAKDPPDWAVRCGNLPDGGCYLVQNIFLSGKEHPRLAGIALRRQGTGYRLLVTTPLGVALPAGVEVQIETRRPLHLPYQVCTAQGCLAEADVAADLLRAMERGMRLTVSYRDTAGRAIGIPGSLKDFRRGLEALKGAHPGPAPHSGIH